MIRQTVDKVVALCLLESAKSVLEALGRHRMEMAHDSIDPPRELAACYGGVRRVRDYLARAISVPSDQVEFDLPDEDQDLLLAAMLRHLEALTIEVDGPRGRAIEADDWRRKKTEILAEWAPKFADRIPQALPLPNLPPSTSAKVRAVLRAVSSRATQKSKVSRGVEVWHESAMQPSERSTGSLPAMASPVADVAPIEPQPSGVNFFNLVGDATQGTDENRGSKAGSLDGLAEPRSIQDPRLRSIFVTDLHAYEVALRSDDFRMAAVHLASLLEGAAADYALRNRASLKLADSPELWNLQNVIEGAMVNDLRPTDTATLHQIFTSRTLLRPLIQLLAPIVVSESSLRQYADLAARTLEVMGFCMRPSVGGVAPMPANGGAEPTAPTSTSRFGIPGV